MGQVSPCQEINIKAGFKPVISLGNQRKENQDSQGYSHISGRPQGILTEEVSLNEFEFIIKNYSPDRCVSVGWVSFRKAKGCQLDSQSGHTPGLWVWSPGWVCTRSTQRFFLTLMFLPLSFSLPFPLSKNK